MRSLGETSIQYVKGVGPARKKLFANLGVETVEDLLYLFPRRYEDRRNITPIAQVKVGEWQTVVGKVTGQGARKSWYTKKHVTEVTFDDGSGRICGVWFNQPYVQNYLKEGKQAVCYGKVDVYKNRLQMVAPEYELIDSDGDEALNIKRIVPIYPLTRGMSQRYIRKVTHACLVKYADQLVDELPVPLRNKHRLSNIKRSICAIHFPESLEDQESALRRISFEEFFFFQVSVILRRLSITRKSGVAHKIGDAKALDFIHGLPFELTGAQKKAIREIRADMERPTPMLRLLQGDVGSGKTVVAFFGCLVAFESGRQSAIMAPTEILARQHYENVVNLFKGFKGHGTKGFAGQISKGAKEKQNITNPKSFHLLNPKIALLTSGLKKEEKEKILKGIQRGEFDILVGTHALINEEVTFKNLSFAVIDEQHKFGVRQRAMLSAKGVNPDILIMTATPIPRTLCITLYGDLDLSIIDELPPGRGKTKTKLYAADRSEAVYTFVRQKVEEGRQAYVVYPIVEESEKLDLKAAEKMYDHFKKHEFKDLRLGLIHGQMKQDRARKVMAEFKAGKIDVLVATTVLEVGVDVPNASVMVVEHAERFGLAQLHQLRGRIGRGAHASYCLLLAEETTDEARERLKAVASTNDGFKIAQHDLEIRGPGRFFGRHQHGLNELKVADPAKQLDILELARTEALELTREDPNLERGENVRIKDVIRKRYPTYLAMVEAG